MKLKHSLLVVIGALVIVSLLIGGCAAPAPAPTPTPTPTPTPKEVAPKYPTMVLTVTSFLPPPPAIESETVDLFVKEIEKRTEGAVTFDVHYGAALAGPLEHIDVIGTGVADMGIVAYLYTPTRWPLWKMDYEFPFNPRSPLVAVKLRKQMMAEFPQFEAELANANLKHIAHDAWDDYSILSSEPIPNLAAFEGKKIGVLGGYLTKMVEAAGGVPVTSPAPERYLQLKNRVIDASVLTVTSFADTKQWEVGSYVIHTHLGAHDPVGLVVNLDKWNEFTPELRALFLEVGDKIGLLHAQHLIDAREGKAALLEEHGVTIYDLSAADLAAWAAAAPDLPAAWAAEMEELGLPGKEMANRYMEIAEELGYVWPRDFTVR